MQHDDDRKDDKALLKHDTPAWDAQEVRAQSLRHTLFAWQTQAGLEPMEVVFADGAWLHTRSGEKLLDFSSQLVNINLGHNHPEIKAAIAKQMASVSCVAPGVNTEVRARLGKALADYTPGGPERLDTFFFTNGGADAVENGIKLARALTGRSKIVTRYRSYHGSSYGAMSASGDPRRHGMDTCAMPGIVRIEGPYCYRCPWQKKPQSCAMECVAHLERVIAFEGPQSIAAILLEGESGTSGCLRYPPDYWPKVRALCDAHGILLIADEVMSGFGRCGYRFGVDRFGVVPDMMLMAKGLTSGYIPMGAVAVDAARMKMFDTRPLPLGLTTSAHPLACAAALACINIYQNENIAVRVKKLEPILAEGLQALAQKHACIGDVRLTGFLGVLELVSHREKKTPWVAWNAQGSEQNPSKILAQALHKAGMTTLVRWNFVFIAPPLTILEDDLKLGLEMLDEALGAVGGV